MRPSLPSALKGWLVTPLVLIVLLMLAACVGTGGKNTQPSGQSDLSTALAIASVTNVGGRMTDIARPLAIGLLVEEARSHRGDDLDDQRQVLALAYQLFDAAMVAASREADAYLIDGLERRFSGREQQTILDFLNSPRGRSTFDRVFEFLEILVEAEVFGGPVDEDAISAELTMMARNQPGEVTRFMSLIADAAVEFSSALSRNIDAIEREIDRLAV